VTSRSLIHATAFAWALGALVHAQQPTPVHELGIKYMRDSEEYATLARQVYRTAGEAVMRAATERRQGQWAVVLDVDDTALDNSTYQLERAAYGLPYDDESWGAWVVRRAAPAVPGVTGFVEVVRRSGGRVAWITNRRATLTDPTRDNLKAAGVWTDDDRLCLQKNAQDPKATRRREVMTGTGDCSWPQMPMTIVVFVGDQLGDFPDAAERMPDTGTDAAFGRTCFLLPNSMYGAWTTRVTRVRTGAQP
jgi:5'-nucleotidase (lipoprotein e(P4) family)